MVLQVPLKTSRLHKRRRQAVRVRLGETNLRLYRGQWEKGRPLAVLQVPLKAPPAPST